MPTENDNVPTHKANAPRPATAIGGPEVAACLSLALLLFGSHLLNSAVFPAVAVVFPLGREISTCCGAAMALAMAFVAFRSPRLVREGLWSGICLGVFGASLASLAFGIAQGSALLVALGSPFGGAGQVWFSILIGIALSRIGLARATVCVPSGFALALLAQAIVDASGLLPGYELGILLYFLCTAASYLLIRGPVRRQLAVIRESHSPVVLDATNPHSFLPLGSKAFVAIGLFNAALGYVFGSGVGAGDALLAMLSSIPVLLLFFAMAVMRRNVSPDTVYLLSTALVIAGLLLVPFRFLAPGFPAAQAAPLLLQSGADCFSLLTYLLVASLGARNPIGSLSVSAGVCAAGHFGIACGALAAQGADIVAKGSPDGASWSLLLLAVLMFAFILFNLIAMKDFSFARLVAGLRPVPLSLALPNDEEKAADERAQQAADSRLAESPSTRSPLRAVAADDFPPSPAARQLDKGSGRIDAGEFPSPQNPFVTADTNCPPPSPAVRFEDTSPARDPRVRPAGAEALATGEPAGPAGKPSGRPQSADLDERCAIVAHRFQLTPREAEVLALLARGRTSPIIQEKLVVSQNTVRTHVRHIYAKLGVHSQQELINLVDEAE